MGGIITDPDAPAFLTSSLKLEPRGRQQTVPESFFVVGAPNDSALKEGPIYLCFTVKVRVDPP